MPNIRYSVRQNKGRRVTAKVELLSVKKVSFNIDTEDVTAPNWRYMAPYLAKHHDGKGSTEGKGLSNEYSITFE